MIELPTLLVLVFGFLAILISSAVMLILHRRRQQIAELMQRVAELEERLAPEELAPDISSLGIRPTIGGQEAGREGQEAGGDILAGWTTHIGRLLAEEARPTDLADETVVTIYRCITEPLQPSTLADELDISLRTLERFLLGSLNTSPGRLIMAVKLREAKRMLQSGHFRVGEVAHRLAFADAAHFSRRYRQYFRCPPSQHLPDGD